MDRFEGVRRRGRGAHRQRFLHVGSKLVVGRPSVIDARFAYVGSARWTGAGLGVRGDGKRNFEMGVLTQDDAVIDAVQASFERVWRGAACGACQLPDPCEMPLVELDR